MLALVIAGTRPELIKLSPVIRAFEKKNVDFKLIATGQHYDFELFWRFVKELELPQPEENLDVGSGSHAKQTARAMVKLEEVIAREMPDVVVAQGDTNSVLATSLACAKLCIPFAHVEAGLRSYDITMPEEINRIVADRLASVLFAPTPRAALNLVNEGVKADRVFITGNTIVDATLQNLEIAERKAEIELPEEFCLLTLHRAENVDSKKRLAEILGAIAEVDLPVLFPVHPRTERRLREFGIEIPANVTALQPLGYLDFLYALSRCRVVLTDSGGVQEEALTLKKPCVTLRTSTERPETIEAGGNLLAGVRGEEIRQVIKIALAGLEIGENPLGDGKSGERIVDILLRLNSEKKLKIEKPEKKIGEEVRKFLRVDRTLAGKKVGDLNIDVQRIINGENAVFPEKDLLLKENMLLEVIERRFF